MLDKSKLNKVWQVYAVGIVAYVILIVLAVILMNEASFNLTTNYFTSNDLASQTTTVFANATSTLWIIQYKYALVFLLGLSIVEPALIVYLINVKKKSIDFHKLRWMDWAVTGGVMISIIALLSSLEDLMTVIFIIGLYVVGSGLIWVATHHIKDNKIIFRRSYGFGLACIILPWIMIAFYAVGTVVYGDIRDHWYTYVLYLIGILATAVVAYGPFWHQAKVGKEKLITTELYPVAINQLIKVLFSIILIIGLS